MSSSPPGDAARPALAAARGAIVTGRPEGGITLEQDGLLVWDAAGVLVYAGPAGGAAPAAEVVAGGAGALLLAGFWDPHVHLPQLGIAGRYREPLLPWLEKRVFPEEARHATASVAEAAAPAFLDALAHAGSVGAGVLAAPFDVSAEAALAEALRRRLPLRCGPSLMDEGGALGLVRSTEECLKGQAKLARRFGESAAVVPRFALSCTPELLAGCSVLAAEHGAWVLGHIAETTDETRAVLEARQAESYAGVYDDAGLLGPRTVLAHGVWLDEGERRTLAKTGTWIAHCPTSNEALGSGRMPLEALREAGVPWCLASDVGAGPELSMLDVMDVFLRVHEGHTEVTACEAFWRATLAGARALGFAPRRGALLPGRSADFLVVNERLPRSPTPEDVLRELLRRGERGRWDALIAETWVGGRRCQPG